jgi:hypothetical protein
MRFPLPALTTGYGTPSVDSAEIEADALGSGPDDYIVNQSWALVARVKALLALLNVKILCEYA